jgi:Rieske Fe-S protein
MEMGVHLLGAAATLMVGVPVLGALTSPLTGNGKKEDWTAVGPADRFTEGETVKVVYKNVKKDGWLESENPVTVYVTRRAEEYQVLSATCTHLGCAVNWDPGAKRYQCPCHNGAFDPEGKVLFGPPPQPLTRLRARVNQEGQLEVLQA